VLRAGIEPNAKIAHFEMFGSLAKTGKLLLKRSLIFVSLVVGSIALLSRLLGGGPTGELL